LARDAQEQVALLEAFLVTSHHFLGDWTTLFAPIQDPRAPQLITYPLPSLLFTGMLMFLGRLGARRQVMHLLRRNRVAVAQCQALFGTAQPSLAGRLRSVSSSLEVKHWT